MWKVEKDKIGEEKVNEKNSWRIFRITENNRSGYEKTGKENFVSVERRKKPYNLIERERGGKAERDRERERGREIERKREKARKRKTN